MKKLILLLLIVVSVSFSPAPYATTWAGTGNLQGITFSALKNAVDNGFVYQSPAATIPTTLELITKADLTTYNIINYADFVISGKSSNQVLIKSDFMIIKIDVSAGQPSCGGTNFTQLIYTSSSVIDIGTVCYTNKERTTTYTGDGTSWYGYITFSTSGVVAIKINSSGVITDFFAC